MQLNLWKNHFTHAVSPKLHSQILAQILINSLPNNSSASTNLATKTETVCSAGKPQAANCVSELYGSSFNFISPGASFKANCLARRTVKCHFKHSIAHLRKKEQKLLLLSTKNSLRKKNKDKNLKKNRRKNVKI